MLKTIVTRFLGEVCFNFVPCSIMEKEKAESEGSVCAEARESGVQETGEDSADGERRGSQCPPDEKWLFTWAKVWTPKAYNSSHFLLTGPDRFSMSRFSSIFIVQLLQRILNYRKYSDGLYMNNILLVLYCWLGFL